EWDAVIREAKNDNETQKIYLNLLRSWFKNSSFTPRVVAGAYMTGILPIKKDGSQSAISDFKEFTILNPGPFAQYTGFTEEEVRALCQSVEMDFSFMKKWYDGYHFDKVGSVYNPYSVMEAVSTRECESHWQKTSAAESLVSYINMDWEGLQADIVKLMTGEELAVNVRTFMNDFESFHSKDDVITLLIHLGYLAYNKAEKTVHIPNEEVRQEFQDILKNPKRTKLAELVSRSEKLLEDTLAGNEKAVASAIEKIRETNYAPQYYNNEQALRYAVKFAYIVCVDRFMKIEELPGGKGLADIVFVPNRNTAYPAMIIELKWNKTADQAAEQIEDKKYAAVLKGYTGDIVKVGINYDAASKIHDCRIFFLKG
ncbi:MAG: AAA family ATPase, partial [Lachnospiraceae bacterium]|nr:AAA family ATPase [Lachnospiraceae bacterium]